MDQFIDSIRSSAAILAGAVDAGPVDAPVAACPGWDVAELGRHIGFIHRWARLAAQTGAAPDPDDIEPPPPVDQLPAWIETGAAALCDQFVGLDPAAPTWHPFPVAKVAAVWPRRQAHETLIHAWDAGAAIGRAPALDPAIAADNVREYFEVMIPRLLVRTGRVAPGGVVRVSCSDVEGCSIVIRSDGTAVVIDDAATADGLIAGRAEDVALALWGRRPLTGAADGPVAASWLAFGGN